MSRKPLAVMHQPTLLRRRPVSNTERQRQFRERNPGYYGRLHRRQNAEMEARIAARAAAEAAAKERVEAAVPVEGAPVPWALPMPKPMLCLPAPRPVVTLAMLLSGRAVLEPALMEQSTGGG